MADLMGQKFVFAVAQKPFETAAADTGVFNQFCALLPLFDSDGNLANPQAFPDNGDVWWMLRPGTRGLAEPGRLVTGIIEDSVKKGVRGFSQYQVIADSVEPVRGRDYVEIIDVPVTDIQQPRDLVRSDFRLPLYHVPIDTVYLLWGDKLLGRFRAVAEPTEEEGRWNIRFSVESTDNKCISVAKDILDIVPDKAKLKTQVDVSLERRPLHESSQLITCDYFLVESDALHGKIPSDVTRVSIRTDAQVIQQVAKKLLSRNTRQQLSSSRRAPKPRVFAAYFC